MYIVAWWKSRISSCLCQFFAYNPLSNKQCVDSMFSFLLSLFLWIKGTGQVWKTPSYLHYHRRYRGSRAAPQMGGHQPVFFLAQMRSLHSPLI